MTAIAPAARKLRSLPSPAIGLIPAAMVAIVVLFAIVPALLAPYDPIKGVIAERLQAPSLHHVFGTDDLGRDVFSRFVFGARLSLAAAGLAVVIGYTIGITIGSFSAIASHRVDTIVMRIIDMLLSIPSLLMAVTIISVLGFGTINIAIAVGISNVAVIARLMRSRVLEIRRELYIAVSKLAGLRPWQILVLHAIPNAIGVAASLAVVELGMAVMAVASLSFLGFGANPPNPEWGSMISDGQPYLIEAWWISTLPGLCIGLLLMSLNGLSKIFSKHRVGSW